ncbi:MAG: hypothetical protein R3Y26_07635 [Rikenellaceae bacterium]
MKKIIYLFGIIVTILSSCTKLPGNEGDDNPETPDSDINIVIINDETLESSCTSINENQITFSSLDKNQTPSVGDIINGGVSTVTPDGFLGRVTSVDSSSGEVSISYEIVAIEDVVEELDIDETYELNIEEIVYYDEDGNIIDEDLTKSEYGASAEVTLSESYTLSNGNTVLKSQVSLSAGISANLKYEIKDYTIDEFEFTITPSVELKSTLSYAVEAKYEKTIAFATVIYSKIKFVTPAGIIIILTPSTDYGVTFAASGKAELDATLSGSISIPVGFSYEKGVFKDIFDPKVSGGVKFSGGISGTASVGLTANTIIYPYIFRSLCIGTEISFPTLELSAGVSSTTTVSSTSLDAKVSFSAGVSSSNYIKAGVFKLSYESGLLAKSETLWSENALPTIDNFGVSTYGSVTASYDLKSAPYFNMKSSGFCWSKSPNPQITDNINDFGTLDSLSTVNNYSYSLPDLSSNQTYYIRPYFEGCIDTYYGEETSFTTSLTEMSITVGDNGNWADDAYEVYLNDHLIGTTDIGAINNIGIDNLNPGYAILMVKCIVAPDDVGTLGITLNNGITIYGESTTSLSATLTCGESKQWIINIPEVPTTTTAVMLYDNSQNEFEVLKK